MSAPDELLAPPMKAGPIAPEGRATRVRFLVITWFSLAAIIAYVCRTSISVAEKEIRADLGLSEEQIGLALGAFFWAYALGQIPLGALGQRFGSRICLPLLMLAGSVATAGFAITNSLLGLVLQRVGLGVAQAGLFPCCTSSMALWYPRGERGSASGVLSAAMVVGAALGAAITGQALEAMMPGGALERFSWRELLTLYSIPGLLWAVFFYYWFRDRPEDHPGVNQHERKWILSNRDQGSSPAKDEAPPRMDWWRLVSSGPMWLICSQQFFRAAGQAFFFTWFATYLRETREVTLAGSGWLTAMPLLTTVVAGLLGGGLSDWVYHRTGSLNLARKGVSVASCFACVVLVAAAYFVEDAAIATFIISLGSFFAGISSPCAYAVTIDMGGRHVAPVFGTMNMIGNFGAGLFPILVPQFKLLVESNTRLLDLFGGNSWNAILPLFGAMYMAAAVSWMMLRTEGTVFDRQSS